MMVPGLAPGMTDAPAGMGRRWAEIHWRAVAGLAALGTGVLLLLVEGLRTTRLDLLLVAGACILLGWLAWSSRNQTKRSVA
jgi:hypothetical protein